MPEPGLRAAVGDVGVVGGERAPGGGARCGGRGSAAGGGARLGAWGGPHALMAPSPAPRSALPSVGSIAW